MFMVKSGLNILPRWKVPAVKGNYKAASQMLKMAETLDD